MSSYDSSARISGHEQEENWRKELEELGIIETELRSCDDAWFRVRGGD